MAEAGKRLATQNCGHELGVKMSEQFNWYDHSNADIVVHPTLGIAVYMSDLGYLVITQEGSLGEEDTTITINPGDIERFAMAVQNAKGG